MSDETSALSPQLKMRDVRQSEMDGRT